MEHKYNCAYYGNKSIYCIKFSPWSIFSNLYIFWCQVVSSTW